MLHGRYPADVIEGGIPCSDAAAEVAAVGSAVKDFAIGDRVSVIGDLGNLTGCVLREYAIFEDKYSCKCLSTCHGKRSVALFQSPPTIITKHFVYTTSKIPDSYPPVCWCRGLDRSRRPQSEETSRCPLARFVPTYLPTYLMCSLCINDGRYWPID